MLELNESKKTFLTRLNSEWLPEFCLARSEDITEAGFRPRNLEKLTEFDAKWFLNAIDCGYVRHAHGFFENPLSAAREQIFWEGPRSNTPRHLDLWLEPIITIGAIARMVQERGWPASRLGLQSRPPWPFDFSAYHADLKTELVVCEVKKSSSEVVRLIEHMKNFCSQITMEVEPVKSVEKNAYKKVIGIRASWPEVLWALGPNGGGCVFKIAQTGAREEFLLKEISISGLDFQNFN